MDDKLAKTGQEGGDSGDSAEASMSSVVNLLHSNPVGNGVKSGSLVNLPLIGKEGIIESAEMKAIFNLVMAVQNQGEEPRTEI